jgi:hypothetical protein
MSDIDMGDAAPRQDIHTELADLRTQIRRLAAQRPQPPQQTSQTKETYKIFEQYDHSEPSLWPQFKVKLQAKVRIDGPTIGSEENKIYRLFSYLTGTAAQRALPWVETYASSSNINDFLGHLHALFGDPTRERKALTRLNTIRQGKRPFSEFAPEFDQVLLEAGASGWDDRAKIGFLQAAISLELRERIVGIPQEKEYVKYCTQLREVSQQIEELQWIKSRTGRRRSATPLWRSAPEQATPQDDNTMDWEPTQAIRLSATSQSGPRASARGGPRGLSRGGGPVPRPAHVPGVPENVLQDRIRQRVCLRCAVPGHRYLDCLSAVNSGTQKPRVNRNRVPQASTWASQNPHEEAPEVEDLEESDESQGKV